MCSLLKLEKPIAIIVECADVHLKPFNYKVVEGKILPKFMNCDMVVTVVKCSRRFQLIAESTSISQRLNSLLDISGYRRSPRDYTVYATIILIKPPARIGIFCRAFLNIIWKEGEVLFREEILTKIAPLFVM